MDETSTNFLLHRAQCYFDQEIYDKSIEDLNLGLEISKQDPQLYYKLGLSLYAAEDYKKAVKSLKIALNNKPFISYEADIYYHVGLAYCRQEKFEKAIYPFTKCID